VGGRVFCGFWWLFMARAGLPPYIVYGACWPAPLPLTRLHPAAALAAHRAHAAARRASSSRTRPSRRPSPRSRPLSPRSTARASRLTTSTSPSSRSRTSSTGAWQRSGRRRGGRGVLAGRRAAEAHRREASAPGARAACFAQRACFAPRSLAAFGAAHGVPFSPAHSTLSYLPLAHVFGRRAGVLFFPWPLRHSLSLLCRVCAPRRVGAPSIPFPTRSGRIGARFCTSTTPDRDSPPSSLSRAHRPPPLPPLRPRRSATEELVLYTGGSIGFWRGDIKLLVEDIEALKPTLFAGVPRVYDRIYAGVVAKVRRLQG
jgi:hypothetical protein